MRTKAGPKKVIRAGASQQRLAHATVTKKRRPRASQQKPAQIMARQIKGANKKKKALESFAQSSQPNQQVLWDAPATPRLCQDASFHMTVFARGLHDNMILSNIRGMQKHGPAVQFGQLTHTAQHAEHYSLRLCGPGCQTEL